MCVSDKLLPFVGLYCETNVQAYEYRQISWMSSGKYLAQATLTVESREE